MPRPTTMRRHRHRTAGRSCRYGQPVADPQDHLRLLGLGPRIADQPCTGGFVGRGLRMQQFAAQFARWLAPRLVPGPEHGIENSLLTCAPCRIRTCDLLAHRPPASAPASGLPVCGPPSQCLASRLRRGYQPDSSSVRSVLDAVPTRDLSPCRSLRAPRPGQATNQPPVGRSTSPRPAPIPQERSGGDGRGRRCEGKRPAHAAHRHDLSVSASCGCSPYPVMVIPAAR